MKRILTIIIALILAFSLFGILTEAKTLEKKSVEIDYFYIQGCGACAQMKPFLEEIKEKHNIILNSYEISTKENSNRFRENLERNNVPMERRGYVPAVFIQDSYFIGFNQDITSAIEKIIIEGSSNGEGVFGGDVVETKILGFWDVSVSFKDRSIITSTIILGFLDSMNVCSITVLVFLIVYTLSIGSLKRAFKLGLIFTFVIYIFYFLFMVALTALISSLLTNYGTQIRWTVILLSLFAGTLLIKDYFFYGKWISLRVPDSAKPILEKYIKQGTIISTITFALLASLVELPCTAIFPLIYSTILADRGIWGIGRLLWIALYNLIYVLPLLIIVFGTYLSWTKITDVDEKIQKLKKVMKLIAGVALLLIALYFIWPWIST
jgi:thiol-disulfide isomerase/thioredoxin